MPSVSKCSGALQKYKFVKCPKVQLSHMLKCLTASSVQEPKCIKYPSVQMYQVFKYPRAFKYPSASQVSLSVYVLFKYLKCPSPLNLYMSFSYSNVLNISSGLTSAQVSCSVWRNIYSF